MGDTHKMILNETGINVDQTEKKHAVFPAKFSLFFGKKCGFVHRKISDEKVKKNEVQKKMPFLRQKFLDTPRRPILLWDAL